MAQNEVFYRERDKIYQDLKNGGNPYGSYENAVNSIYNTYGRNSGVSYQEVAGILGEAYQGAQSDSGTPTGGGTGTGSGSSAPAFKVVFQGVTYTDPEAYKAALNAAALEELNRTKTSLKRQFDEGMISYEQMTTQLNQNRQQILKQRDDNYASNAQYFANVSPDAYQSQQGNYENNVTADWSQKNTNLDTQAGNIERGKGNLGTDYNNQVDAAQRTYQSNLDSYANNVNSIQSSGGSIAAPTNQYQAQQVTNAETTNQMGGVKPVGLSGGGFTPGTTAGGKDPVTAGLEWAFLHKNG